MPRSISTYIPLTKNDVATTEGEKQSLYSWQSYDQLEILFPWRKERIDIGKELEGSTIGTHFGIKL